MSDDDLAAVALAVRSALAGPCEVAAGVPIAVACSGGADSVALVHALGRLADRNPLTAVAFVDHGLRDVATERAAAAAAAASVGATFLAAVLGPGDLAAGNLQAMARHARYRALHDLVPSDTLIATGHTADDQTETLLARAARGTGLQGLRGVRPRDGRLIRPLLSVPRAVTRALGLRFADDPSNDTPRFLRNRLRATVVPALQAENPRIHEAFAALADAADGALALLDALLGDAEATREVDGSDRLEVPPAALRGPAFPALLRQIASRLAPEAPPSRDALNALVRAIATAPERAAGGSLGNGWAAAWHPDTGELRLTPERDPRVRGHLDGPGRQTLHGVAVAVVPWATAPPDAVPIPRDARWPLRVRAHEAGGVTVCDASDAPLWPEGSCVPSCSGSAGDGSAASRGPFALDVTVARPLTVVARGFHRVQSVDSLPPKRPGRLR